MPVAHGISRRLKKYVIVVPLDTRESRRVGKKAAATSGTRTRIFLILSSVPSPLGHSTWLEMDPLYRNGTDWFLSIFFPGQLFVSAAGLCTACVEVFRKLPCVDGLRVFLSKTTSCRTRKVDYNVVLHSWTEWSYLWPFHHWYLVFNVQSTAKIVSGRNAVRNNCQKESLIDCYDTHHFVLEENWEKMELSEPGS